MPVLLQVGKSYASAKEAVIMTGNFLLEQLRQLDCAAGGKATFAFGSTAFVSALTSEVSVDNRPSQLPPTLSVTQLWHFMPLVLHATSLFCLCCILLGKHLWHVPVRIASAPSLAGHGQFPNPCCFLVTFSPFA